MALVRDSNIGSARLFNALKPATLAAFERKQLSDNELESIVSKLLSVGIWHQRGEAPNMISHPPKSAALTVAPRPRGETSPGTCGGLWGK